MPVPRLSRPGLPQSGATEPTRANHRTQSVTTLLSSPRDQLESRCSAQLLAVHNPAQNQYRREGDIVATLIRWGEPKAAHAVSVVHGYTDYFFHTELANHFTNLG